MPGGGSLADDVWEVLVQRTAEGDVEDLVTAADRQYRLVLGDGRPRQCEVDSVVLVAHLDEAGMKLVDAVPMGRDIRASWEAQPVDPRHHVAGGNVDIVRLVERWHGDRGAPGADDRLLVRAPQRRRRDAPGVGTVGEPRRQGDEGAHPHQRTVHNSGISGARDEPGRGMSAD